MLSKLARNLKPIIGIRKKQDNMASVFFSL